MNDSRRERLRQARLYLVCDEQPDAFLDAALSGGVDLVQLRMKNAPDERILAAARRFARVCAEHRALLIINDRPDLVKAAGADGVHVGQDDVPVSDARSAVGPELLVGLSTHTPEQIDRAPAAGADYIGVGPVNETPTKPGRPAVGLELVRYAAANAAVAFFAIGGISEANIGAVASAGASRAAIVRALVEAQDPSRTAWALREALAAAERAEVGVGTT